MAEKPKPAPKPTRPDPGLFGWGPSDVGAITPPKKKGAANAR